MIIYSTLTEHRKRGDQTKNFNEGQNSNSALGDTGVWPRATKSRWVHMKFMDEEKYVWLFLCEVCLEVSANNINKEDT